MEDNVHDVVKLLLARMESHPEEFRDPYLLQDFVSVTWNGRWEVALRAIKDNGSEQDLEALNKALGAIRMNQIHEWTMDELCNGDERRRKHQEEAEANRQRYAGSQVSALGQAMQNTKADIAQNVMNNMFKYQPATDTYEYTTVSGVHSFTRETLEDNPGIFASIKKALGI